MADSHVLQGLWIECPDCEGCGGWYGCASCGAVLSREEPPVREFCEGCRRCLECYEDGGHELRLNKTAPRREEWLFECGCGYSYPARVIAWDGRAYLCEKPPWGQIIDGTPVRTTG